MVESWHSYSLARRTHYRKRMSVLTALLGRIDATDGVTR